MIAKVKMVEYEGYGLILYQLLLLDVGDYTDHGALSSYMEKADSEETSQMPSTPLRQMYHLMNFVNCISSQATGDMELDHEDHPLAVATNGLGLEPISANFCKSMPHSYAMQ